MPALQAIDILSFIQEASALLQDKPLGTGLLVGPQLYVVQVPSEGLLVVEVKGVGLFDSAFEFTSAMWNEAWKTETRAYLESPQFIQVPGFCEYLIGRVVERCSETARSPGARMRGVMEVLGLDFGDDQETDAQWSAYYLQALPAHTLDMRDKNGQPLKEGDVVIGHLAYMDGYLPKRYPSTIRKLFLIAWEATRGGYELRELGTHPDDEGYTEDKYYRRHLYSLTASPRTGRCESLELYRR